MEEEEHKFPPQIHQKLEEFNSKIQNLESSLQKKDEEIVILKYAYENLLATVKLLENKKIYKNLPEAPRIYLPPKDSQLVNTVLKKIGSARVFGFFSLQNLINLRMVCKTWNSELSVILIEKYKKSWLFNEETKKKVEQVRNQANDEFVAAISAVQNRDLTEIKAIRMPHPILNELFIAILFFFGEKSEVKDEKGNVFGQKFSDINSFMAKVLQHNISKKMSASALAKVKNHINKFNLSYQELNRVSSGAANLFRVLECKVKWEDFLNENLKDENIFIADEAKEFFEKLGK